MSGTSAYGYRLTDRGDLVKIGAGPSNHAEIPEKKRPEEDEIFTPPSPPRYPPPPLPAEQSAAVSYPPHRASPSDISAGGTNGHSTPNTESNHSPRPPPLQQYADRDIRSLDRNPMHNDIMNAAEKFRGRREISSVNDALNCMQKGEPVQSDCKKVTESLKPSSGLKHPVYDPDEMRRRKNETFVVNSEMRWNQPNPLQKRNTYTVIPSSQLPSHMAEMQNSTKLQPKRAASVSEGMCYKKIEEVPDVDVLINSIPTHDEKGNVIPEWKRKLMARNYRVKLCSQLPS